MTDKRTRQNPHVGSDFDTFLAEEGLLANTESVAIKQVIGFRIRPCMQAEHLCQSETARRLNTSRSSLERRLDPTNEPLRCRRGNA